MPQDLEPVFHAVDVRNLFAIEGGDLNLGDSLSGRDHLQDDLGVEVKFVGVVLKINTAKRRNSIGPVARVPFGKRGADQPVL